MLTKQLAEVQKRSKELEVENLRLREQVCKALMACRGCTCDTNCKGLNSKLA